MPEPTVTQLANLKAIELTEVVAFPPGERVYCRTLGLYVVDGAVSTCGHFREMEDCRYCYESGTEHKPCSGCG